MRGTGAINNIVLRCGEFDIVRVPLDRRGAEYTVNDLSGIGLWQIFTADPNNVLLELNFFEAGRRWAEVRVANRYCL